MKLNPLADRVILKQNKAEEKTAGGILLTQSAQEKPEVYEVVMTVKVGQNVLVGKYSGSKVKLEDVEYTIVRQSDILAVIE